MKRLIKQVSVFEEESIPEHVHEVKDFVDFWLSVVGYIPNEFVHAAKIKVEVTDEWGAYIPVFSLWYTRPETDEELEKRGKLEQAGRNTQKEADIDEYNRIKEKYNL